jgi:dihydroxy-acid dehydratase
LQGFIIGHIAPEAQLGGPLALVENGDVITIDAEKKSIAVELEDAILDERRKTWIKRPLKVSKGYLYKFAQSVRSASEGCVTDA